jgi:hypothetical protein
MFDWLGTFNSSQFNRLVAYAKSRLPLIEGRVRHLTIEKQRIGTLQFVYDTAGKPVAYNTGSAGGVTTYIGQLMVAYEVLGGDPFYDLQVRSMNDPVYRVKGTETVTARVLSNGEPIPQSALADAPSGNAVRLIKAWVADDLDRLERLERKVRRMVDYSDQLQAEIDTLEAVTGSVETDGSLENLVASVQQLLSDPTYRAIADDRGRDPFGKFTYAPMSSYEPGNRTTKPGVSVERTNSGYVVSGDDGSGT